jgi:hypothetical protein
MNDGKIYKNTLIRPAHSFRGWIAIPKAKSAHELGPSSKPTLSTNWLAVFRRVAIWLSERSDPIVPARAGERQRRFLETPFWYGLPGGLDVANGDVEGGSAFLSCFGFFFSRLLLCWPLATGHSFKGGSRTEPRPPLGQPRVIFATRRRRRSCGPSTRCPLRAELGPASCCTWPQPGSPGRPCP